MVEISASILNLEEDNVIKRLYDLEAAKIDYFHIDVMDGIFVENNTVQKMKKYCEYLNNISNLPIDVHLMVTNVKEYVNEFLVFKPNIITVHLEAFSNKDELKEIIKYIKENNTRVGISIKPDTKIDEIFDTLKYIHQVLIMTVEPGKGGQSLIPQTLEKVKALNELIKKENIDIDIEVDGGINEKTATEAKKAGANILVAGTAITRAEDYKKIVEELKREG